jgi:hypothetical protein
MAALVLSIAGAAAGGSVLGPVGAIVGRLVGAVAGNLIDRALLGSHNIAGNGPRLADLTIMASTEQLWADGKPLDLTGLTAAYGVADIPC